jgi:hypothetical protein
MTADPKNLSSRISFSLRELFVLVTLACILLAGGGLAIWSDIERWLLGLTIGGTLLGNLVARLLARRGWPWGLTIGGIGAAVALALAAYQVYQEYFSGSPFGASSFTITKALWGVAILGSLTSLLLILLTQFTIAGLLWMTSVDSTGALTQVRRHPWRAVATFGLLGVIIAAGCCAESLFWPKAIPARAVIEFKEGAQPLVLQSGTVDLALSRDGSKLAVSFELGWPEDATSPDGRTWFYDVAAAPGQIKPRLINPPGVNPFFRHQVAFDSASDRLAVLNRQGDQAGVILDLQGNTVYPPLQRVARNDWLFYRLQWLPHGRLLFEDYVKEFTIFDTATGATIREDAVKPDAPASEEQAEVETPKETIRYEARLNHRYHFVHGMGKPTGSADFRAVRVYDLQTDQLLWDIPCDMSASDRATVSPDGQFILQMTPFGQALLDVRKQKYVSLQGSDWLMAPSGRVVFSSVDSGRLGFREPMWTDFVPLVRHPAGWWNRPRLVWLEPQSGCVVARTVGLRREILKIEISADGSTVAVVTWDGAYVFDVPQRLR